MLFDCIVVDCEVYAGLFAIKSNLTSLVFLFFFFLQLFTHSSRVQYKSFRLVRFFFHASLHLFVKMVSNIVKYYYCLTKANKARKKKKFSTAIVRVVRGGCIPV